MPIIEAYSPRHARLNSAIASSRVAANGGILRKPHCDRPEPRAAWWRDGGAKDTPDHFGVAVPHVIVIVRPLAAR
ncbi:MAG TPA: hypothetical protein VKI40_09230, partial [Terriglobales bacterium]|nr:hypothetical protein [Terriglobales bacterium]